MKPPEAGQKGPFNKQNLTFPSSFFSDLAHQVQKNLNSIKTMAQFSREKFGDKEFGNYFYRSIAGDVEKINILLEGLRDYIRINTPVEKTNTVHSLLEEALKRHHILLEEKKIRVVKKFEKDLPETTVHDEQLRYIFNSIFDYAISLVPANGSMALLTRSLQTPKEMGEGKTEERYVETLIYFTGSKKKVEISRAPSEVQSLANEEPVDLIMRLVKDLAERNRGTIQFQTNEKKGESLIFLKLPAERRRMIRYPSADV